MKRFLSLIAPAALVLLVACGGGSDPAAPAPSPAASLAYTDPVATSHDWKLVKDASSTGSFLVLNLVGPSDGSTYRGVGFTLKLDPTKLKAGKFKDATGNPLGYYKDGGIFLDKNNAHNDMPPSLQAGGYLNGNLMVGIYQKTDEALWGTDRGAIAKNCSGTVLQVALELDPSLKAMPGEVPLTITKAKLIQGLLADAMWDRRMVPVTIKVGTLTLK